MTVGTASPLKPRGIGELLDQAIRIYRRNFLTFVGIVAIVQIPLTLLGLLSGILTFSGINQPHGKWDILVNSGDNREDTYGTRCIFNQFSGKGYYRLESIL